MDMLFKIMLFLHLTGLAVGTTATVAMPLLGRQLATGAPAAKPALGAIAGQIMVYSRAAFGVMVASGIVMLWIRYNGDVMALGPWFELKLALVVLVFAAMIVSIAAPKAIKPQVLGTVMRLAILGIVASAVMAFN